MKTELDEMYIVIKTNDVLFALSEDDKQELDRLIQKIMQFRVSIGRPAARQYTVVSDVFDCYPKVTQMVLDELNETTN